MIVFLGVLEKDGAISGKEIKGGSNTSSRLAKCALFKKLDHRGREDLQSL